MKTQAETNKEIGSRVAELKKQIDALAGKVGGDQALQADMQKLKTAAEELGRMLPGDGIHGPTGHVNPGPEGVPNPQPAGVRRVS